MGFRQELKILLKIENCVTLLKNELKSYRRFDYLLRNSF